MMLANLDLHGLFAGFSWMALAQVVVLDLLLGGDNAVVIALATRNLPKALRRRAVLLGVAGAIVARVAMLLLAVKLLDLPGLKLVGAALLLWIGSKLLLAGDEEAEVDSAVRFFTAVRTIVVADVVMSLDNVVAMAGAADGSAALAAVGVLLSIPLIVCGSQLILAAIARFSWLVAAGAALLGWVAGGLALADPLLAPWPQLGQAPVHYLASTTGAVLVLGIGRLLRQRALRPSMDGECQ